MSLHVTIIIRQGRLKGPLTQVQYIRLGKGWNEVGGFEVFKRNRKKTNSFVCLFCFGVLGLDFINVPEENDELVHLFGGTGSKNGHFNSTPCDTVGVFRHCS